jgi:hypothetical protein
MNNYLFLVYKTPAVGSTKTIAIGVEFEASGKVVIENNNKSLSYFDSMHDFLESDEHVFIKRI